MGALQDLAPIELSQIEPVTINEVGLIAAILWLTNPRGLPIPVRYKISPVFKCLSWRELSRCSLAMRYKIALQSLLANS